MRLSIERMRTVVLAAAGLLVIAIAAFLGFAKFRHPFNRRDIPQHLGLDIQQEANGVTYTQAHGGHTIFKIHASRVVQLRDNRATLHDVVIELYGKDGARVDRIEGAEFEYDQQATMATASGPVEIDLARPTAAAQTGGPSAKPAANDEIHVKTSGVTFNQTTGIVTTAQRVEFATRQGSGSAMGARYDSDLGELVLDHDVELTTARTANRVTLHAAHAELNRDTEICTLREATAQTRGEQATAAVARIQFRPDSSVERLNVATAFTVSTQGGGRLTAPSGAMEFDAKNQPRRAHLEGGVTMDSSSAGRALHATAPVMDLDFAGAGELRHAHLERGVEMQSREQTPSAANGAATEIARTWRSPVADIDFRPAGKGQVEPAALHGSGGVAITSETRRPGAPAVPSRLAADDLTAQFGAHSTLSSMSGVGHAAMEQTAATGAHETATGDRLQAQFSSAPPAAAQPKPAPPPASALPGFGAAQLETAQLDGHVVLIEEPAQKPGAQAQAPLRATAGRALYEASNPPAAGQRAAEQWLHLTVNPRVSNGGMDVAADKIDIAQSSGDAFAHGNVKATWVNQNPGAGSTAGTSAGAEQGVALGGNGPAHVIAAEAELNQSSGEATFRGRARLWQDQNSISAPVIVLNREQQTLVARAAGTAEPVVTVLLSSEGAPAGPGATSTSRTPSVIRVRSGDLRYSAQDRKALLGAAPLASVVTQTGEAESSSDQLELYLVAAAGARPSGAAAGAGGASQVDRVVALGHVTLTSQGRRGTGAQLVYTAQTGNYVLTGTPSTPPRMTDPVRGTVTGESLLFNSRDDSVSIEGGARQTTTQTTAPR